MPQLQTCLLASRFNIQIWILCDGQGCDTHLWQNCTPVFTGRITSGYVVQMNSRVHSSIWYLSCTNVRGKQHTALAKLASASSPLLDCTHSHTSIDSPGKASCTYVQYHPHLMHLCHAILATCIESLDQCSQLWVLLKLQLVQHSL